jgi:hypothetical protein
LKVTYFNLFLLYVYGVEVAFFILMILQMVGFLGRVMSSSQGLYLNTGQHKHGVNTYTYQTSVPCVRFEPRIPASERAKTVHALDCSVTVTGTFENTAFQMFSVTSMTTNKTAINSVCILIFRTLFIQNAKNQRVMARLYLLVCLLICLAVCPQVS